MKTTKTRKAKPAKPLSIPPLSEFIRDTTVVWYGPHECNGCGQVIVKSSIESGGVALNAPFNHHYPNHQWTAHKCQPKAIPAVLDGKLRTAKLS